MKRVLHILGITVVTVVSVPLAFYLLRLALIIGPCMLFGGSVYARSGMKALCRINGKMRHLDIYKAPDKPFLLVGPCRFSKNETDFFFVNRRQVIRTATDKGGSLWVCVLNRLFILDDLTGSDPLRLPYWDELKGSGKAAVTAFCGNMIYSFSPGVPGRPVFLVLPQKLFTPDMENAPNCTLRPSRSPGDSALPAAGP